MVGAQTQTAYLNPSHNADDTVEAVVAATSEGTLVVNVGKGPESNSRYFQLNALTIEAVDEPIPESAATLLAEQLSYDLNTANSIVETDEQGSAATDPAVEQLIQAMAGFDSPTAGEIILSESGQDQTATVIAEAS